MTKYTKIIFQLFMLMIILGIVTFGYIRYIAPYHLKIVDISFEATKLELPKSDSSDGIGKDELKIAIFSDTHFSEWYTVENFERAVYEINEKSPDLVFFVGDLIDNYRTYTGDVSAISTALSEINASIGKFAIYGNHDYGGGAERAYEGIMQDGGFTVLAGDYYGFDDMKLALIGIDDILIGGGSPDIASWGREDYYNIVLCHEPDIMDSISQYNVDLMISGHTHGGQVHIPGFTQEMLPPYGELYVKGLYEFENSLATRLYVTSGLGMTKLPFRFMAPPDVSFITLKT